MKCEVTAQVMSDWVVTAFEGGSVHWMWAARPCMGKKEGEQQCRCYQAKIEHLSPYGMEVEAGWYQEERFFDDVGNSLIVWTDDGVETIGLWKLQEQIERWCLSHPCTVEDFDAGDADGVMQMACFGKVVYA